MATSALPRGKTTTLLLKSEVGLWHAAERQLDADVRLFACERLQASHSRTIRCSGSSVITTVTHRARAGLVTFDDSIVVPVDFNHIGVWLYALFGDAEVTGDEDPYTHVFRSGLEVLPWRSHEWKLASALFEQDVGLVGSKLDIEMSRAGGFQKATVALYGADAEQDRPPAGGVPGGSLGAGIPCSAATGVFKVGGTVAANIMSVKASYDNKITPQDYLGNELRSGFDLDN